jgi:hypothetical protein
MKTRDEHLAWCKERALEYLRAGDLANAVTSMASDLEKHSETRFNPVLLALGILYVTDHDYDGVKRWIEGFR